MKIGDCRMAVEYLLAYLEDPNQHRAEVDAAITHIRTCSDCQSRVGYLLRALTTTEEDTLTCQECEDLLPEYLHAETIGQATGVRWRPVARHLDMCPHCSAEFADLFEMYALAYGEAGGETPPSYPAVDLSFLREKKVELPASQGDIRSHYLDELGHLIIQFSAELINSWQPPAFATTGLKKTGTSSRILYQYALKEEVEDREITIIAKEKRNDPAHCTVMVEVNIPGRTWPDLAETEVILKHGEQVLEAQLTDAFGQVIFEGVSIADLARLVFEITPGDTAS